MKTIVIDENTHNITLIGCDEFPYVVEISEGFFFTRNKLPNLIFRIFQRCLLGFKWSRLDYRR